MDCYSLNSDAAETLNFLRPPVQRNYRNISSEQYYAPGCSRHSNNVQLMRDYRTKVTKNIQSPIVDKTSIASSTSLVLKKTTERGIFEQYSGSSYTDIQHSNQILGETVKPNQDRPLIKLTVIPNNTAQTQTAKFRKRKHASKRIQNTVSNQENSIKAKNVYLVVAGRKREKVYEIKTTGSAEFANQIYVKDDHDGAEQVTDFKHLMSSLNMDDKKKKGKKKESVHQVSRSSLVNEILEGTDLMADEDIRPHKSRVRITGRIGLADNNRYVLRCDATVDDKPIPTAFTPLPKGVFDDKDPKNVNDSNIQTEFKMKKGFNSSMHARGPSKEIQGKETQSTQTNLNAMCFSNIETLKIFSHNERTICTCKKSNKNAKYMAEKESEFDSPGTSSPLVIISVYPKQETMKTNNENVPCPLRDSRNRSPQRANLNNANFKVRGGKQAVDNNFNKYESKSPRTRSPSPDRNPFRTRIENNHTEIRTTRAKATRESNNQGATSNSNKPRLLKDRLREDTRAKASRLNSAQGRPTSNRKQHNMNATTSKSQEDKGTSTNHMLTKKALVETYTKKISEHMNQSKAPENNVSNININVEAENEFYDFLYHQGDSTTDVRFRKTVKDEESQKEHHIYENMSPSLENFLLFSENGEHRKRSFSQTFLFDDQTNDDIAKLKKPLSRINVRDSIEISHRREQRNSVNSGLMKPQSDASIISNEFLNQDRKGDHFAPIKHFRGDSCSVMNPVLRDKEIRKLLGVDKPRPTTSKPEVSHDTLLMEDHSSVHCFYQVNNQQTVAQVNANGSLCRLYECSMQECPCEEETEYEQKKSKHKPSLRIAPGASPDQTPDSSDAKDSAPSPEESSEWSHKQSRLQIPQTESPVPPVSHPLYQQLILNRNINVYLQIEQFTKQKPIVLSRKQYDKVKRTIETTSAFEKTRKRPCVCKKYSSLTIGEVRRKSKQKEKDTSLKTEKSRKLKQDDEKHEDRKSSKRSEKSKKLDKNKNKENKYVICQCGEDDDSEVICECGKEKDVICKKQCQKSSEKSKKLDKKKDKGNTNVICQCGEDDDSEVICECGKEKDVICKKQCQKSSEKSKKLDKKKDKGNTNVICQCGEDDDSEVICECGKEKDVICKKQCQKSSEKSKKLDKKKDKGNTNVICQCGEDDDSEVICECGKEKDVICKKQCQKSSEKSKKLDKKKDKGNTNVICQCGEDDDSEVICECGKEKDVICKKQCQKSSEKSKKLDKKKDKGNKNVICECGGYKDLVVICECGKQKDVICENRCQKRFTDESKSVSQKTKNTERSVSCPNCENDQNELNNYCCFCGMKNEGNPGKGKACRCTNRSANSSARHAASSVEIHYTSVAYMKRVTFSSTAVETSIPKTRSETNDENNVHRTDSIFTIFKGHRKTPTPNLGTSVYSLYSDYSAAVSPRAMTPDTKPRRPFLRRLMSCLVMRSTRESHSKFDRPAAPKLVSLNSSIDSYHISTSLGAIELSSSIYDTSGSFYSDHSIMPINSKMKRGFLSSVRGFLARS